MRPPAWPWRPDSAASGVAQANMALSESAVQDRTPRLAIVVAITPVSISYTYVARAPVAFPGNRLPGPWKRLVAPAILPPVTARAEEECKPCAVL